ncbi:transcription cofactor HES-6-like [Amblyraja radiata]|uniref:transcription cofactor HES-6-like n=1 Tax=Amblyraja radiata TaxID=386614 RepID=UPI0014036676|nr:transcription cofactor HES-6-like [Amblyraja radiata]
MLIHGYKYGFGCEQEDITASEPSNRSSRSSGGNMTATTFSTNVEKTRKCQEERKLRKPLIERKKTPRTDQQLPRSNLKILWSTPFALINRNWKKQIFSKMTVKTSTECQNSSRIMADTKIGLEAQQRYSAGYIQCMHEVHNLLLTCDWMDRTVGARLLNHLLKSLPRSSEDSRQSSLKTPAVNPQPSKSQLPSATLGNIPAGPAVSPGTVDPSPRSSPDRHCSPGFIKTCGKSVESTPNPRASLHLPATCPTQQLQDDLASVHNSPVASSGVWRPW